MDSIFIQLAIILGLSSTLGYLVHLFNLPLIIAYLFGGLLLSSVSIWDIKTFQTLSFLPEIGIAFVLFLVGMELDFREIKQLGRPIFITGVLQVIITSIVGSSLARFLGLGYFESIYLGLGLSFSSTIVIIKLLLEKKELTSLYGKLSVGILLLEDLLAVLVLLWLSSASSFLNLGLTNSFPAVVYLIKIAILFSSAFLFNRYFIPKIFKAVSLSSELLFLTALSWCFIYVSLAIMLGFSIVVGAFLAGITLATSPYHFQIQSKVKPLRDFFLTLFFVYLGTQVNFQFMISTAHLILLFTLYAVLVKPVIFLLILGIFGFRKHTMFQTALNLSQVSEFSLIIILVGLQSKLVSPESLTIISATAVLSMIISSLMITHANRIYKFSSKAITFFERKNFSFPLESSSEVELIDHVVLIGGHRVGGEVIKFLQKEKIVLVVLDFNPLQVEALKKAKIPAVYGDMSDPEILDSVNLSSAKLLISTSPNVSDNLFLLAQINERGLNLPVIMRAETTIEAKKLYKKGADFVILPEILAGDFLVEKLNTHFYDKGFFKDRAKIELEKLSRKTLALD